LSPGLHWAERGPAALPSLVLRCAWPRAPGSDGWADAALHRIEMAAWGPERSQLCKSLLLATCESLWAQTNQWNHCKIKVKAQLWIMFSSIFQLSWKTAVIFHALASWKLHSPAWSRRCTCT
jgi:hypothetical protein